MPPRLLVPALLVACVLPWPLACSLTSGGIDQVPPSVASDLAAARERGGAYADPPLARYPGALLDSEAVLARFEALERNAASNARAAERSATRTDELERRLTDEVAALRDRQARAADEAAAARADERELVLAAVRDEAQVAAEGRAELADALGEATARLSGDVARVDRSLAELGEAVRSDSERLTAMERRAADEGAAAELRAARVDGRLDAVERTLASVDERLAALAPRVEVLVRAERDAGELVARVEALEGAAAGAGWDGGPRVERLEADVARLDAELARAPEEGAALSELRAELAVVRRAVSPPPRVTTALGSILRADSLGLAAVAWEVHRWTIVIGLAALVLVLTAVSMAGDRRRERRLERRLLRVEQALAGLAERLDAHPAPERSARTAPEPAAAPEPAPRPAPAPAPAPAPVPTTAAGEEGEATRWERFVERVERPRRASAPPEPPPGTRRKRVLDQVFLDQYRYRTPVDGSTNGR